MHEKDSALILQIQWFPKGNNVLGNRVPGCACCHSRDELNSSKESGGSQVGHSLSVRASRALDLNAEGDAVARSVPSLVMPASISS